MPPSLLLLLFNVCLFFTFIDIIASSNVNSIIQLSVYPTSGYSVENIELLCQIAQPSSQYDHVYLSVKTDNVKPSGILLMVDTTARECRIDKKKSIRVNVCNSSTILIHIDHTILNDTFHTIEYACSIGEVYARSSYRILKDQTARFYDPKYSSSSSSLAHTLFLLLISLLIARISTTEEVRWSSI